MAATATTSGASAPTFTPAEWFAAWSDNGGIAMVAQDRLFLSRAPAIDRTACHTLDALRAQIIADRRYGEALAAFLIARSFGETKNHPCRLCGVSDWHPEHGKRCQLPGCPERREGLA